MEVLIALAVSLAAGLMATRVFKALGMNFPDVTAFLLAGIHRRTRFYRFFYRK